jgi:hypothetical protein
MTPEKIAYALQRLAEPERSISSIAPLLGVSRSTLYRWALPDLVTPQQAEQRLGVQLTDRRLRWSRTTSC